MKRLSILTLALGVAVAGCGGSNPAGPGGTPPGNTTATNTYVLTLESNNERPAPVTNVEHSAGGTATIALHTTRDSSGALISAAADFQVNLQGFPAGSTITMAHIHPGDALATGGIIVNTGLTSGEAALANGAATFTKNNVNVTSDVAQGILNGPANYYFNVHSAMNPGGVVRAQMNNTGAPEPAPGEPGSPTYPYPDPGSVR